MLPFWVASAISNCYQSEWAQQYCALLCCQPQRQSGFLVFISVLEPDEFDFGLHPLYWQVDDVAVGAAPPATEGNSVAEETGWKQGEHWAIDTRRVVPGPTSHHAANLHESLRQDHSADLMTWMTSSSERISGWGKKTFSETYAKVIPELQRQCTKTYGEVGQNCHLNTGHPQRLPVHSWPVQLGEIDYWDYC